MHHFSSNLKLPIEAQQELILIVLWSPINRMIIARWEIKCHVQRDDSSNCSIHPMNEIYSLASSLLGDARWASSLSPTGSRLPCSEYPWDKGISSFWPEVSTGYRCLYLTAFLTQIIFGKCKTNKQNHPLYVCMYCLSTVLILPLVIPRESGATLASIGGCIVLVWFKWYNTHLLLYLSRCIYA